MTSAIAPEHIHIADLPEKLRTGQEKALPALIDHFEHNDRGILWMCCGSGKTVTCAINIELRGEPLTVVFTPYIHLVKQWRNDYLKWLPTTKAKFLCVCSEKDPAYEIDPMEAGRLFNANAETSAEEFSELVDIATKSYGQKHGETKVSTDPEEIATFLRQKGRKVVFCTYASSPVYGEAQELAGVHANYGVLDEAQWTATGDKDTVSTYPLHDVWVRIEQRLFTTATVRHYTRDGMAYSMDNELAYGKHVLVDADGNPDPWTIRQAVDYKEVAPYRVVFSFVTDPSLDAGLVQLPLYRDLMQEFSGKADPAEVLRLLGQAMAMERIKEKYGIKKPLGFFNSVGNARLYTDILNKCKQYPDYFPYLSKSDPAVSISTYELSGERRRRVERFHNSAEIEVNNSKLFLFGADEKTIDSIFFGDPMTSNINVVQACGRAQRYVEGKISTIVVPIMLPYYGKDLALRAEQLTKDQIRDAFKYTVDILDSLADMDPLLRDQMNASPEKRRRNPGIIEFDFPETFLPVARSAIEVETWRILNPNTDFIDSLERDAAALERYRLERHPVQDDPEKEAKAAGLRARIRMVPNGRPGYETTARRMMDFRQAIKAYYEAGEKAGGYYERLITADRLELICRYYGWDKDFILQDDFEEDLKQDASTLAEYRLKKHPIQSDPEKEEKASRSRGQIRILPIGQGYDVVERRMWSLRRAIKFYYEAEEKEGKYKSHFITAKRVEQVFKIYGWDKNFVLRDEFEESLKQDSIALDRYRLEKYPTHDNVAEEAKTTALRVEIKIIPQKERGYKTAAYRMSGIRRDIKAYFENGEKDGRYGSYVITAKRVEQVCRIYGWDKNFILRDDFEEDLKRDAVALEKYRLARHPSPVQDDIEAEAKAIRARKKIKIIPYEQKGYESAAARMGNLRKDIKAYYEAGQKEGAYESFLITAKRVAQVYRIYGWNKDFILKDVFGEGLKQDAAALIKYRLEQHPKQNDLVAEEKAASARARIKIIPIKRPGYETNARRMRELRLALKAYYEAGEKEGTHNRYFLTQNRVRQILEIYGWDKNFILQDEFEENLKQDVIALEKYRLEKYPTVTDPKDEAERIGLRAQIRILPENDENESQRRMAGLRRAIKSYYEVGEKTESYNPYRITGARVEQVFGIYGWDKNFILQDEFEENLKQDAAMLAEYRLKKHPVQTNAEEEATAAKLRAQIRIVPIGRGFDVTERRMNQLRRCLKLYYIAGEKAGKYGAFAINAKRVESIFNAYGWDKAFVVRDVFEEALRQDAAALKEYRLTMYPISNDPEKELEAAKIRAQITTIATGKETTASRRILEWRRAIRAYYAAGEREGEYHSHIVTAKRVEQILQAFGWDRSFVTQDDFEEQLKSDAAALIRYRFEQHPKQDDLIAEERAESARAQIKIIPKKKGYETSSVRMHNLRQAIRFFYGAQEKDGRYNSYALTAKRVQQIYDVYGWTKEFVMQDDFEEFLKQDVIALREYRMKRYPTHDDPQEETNTATLRAQIKIIPSQGNGRAGIRMGILRRAIKAYYESGEKEGLYKSYVLNKDRVQKVLEIYGWDRNFIFANLQSAAAKARKRKNEHHRHIMSPLSDTLLEPTSRFSRSVRMALIPAF